MSKNDKFSKEEIGKRFKQCRVHLGLTQSAIAAMLGLTQTTIAGIEKGKSFPTIPTLLDLKKNNHISITWLLSGMGKMISEPMAVIGEDPQLSEYEEEIKDLLFYIKNIPMVRDYILEKFVVYKLRNKKEIQEYLEDRERLQSELKEDGEIAYG